ncbi:MAG: hypothetical protein J6A40_05665 [Bacteroides sp.]|nr:hypothetical protein [Bacteroides sp.]MBR4048852.1 hypothetical protein [Bacteroides sp.]
MKKVFLFLFCMLFALGGNLVFADDGNDKKEIKFEKKTEDLNENNPRELIPVSGYYSLENICLQFYADLGMTEITVVNQTTGATQTTMFDSAFGQTVINIGNANTFYLIYIVTEDGTAYRGTLNL